MIQKVFFYMFRVFLCGGNVKDMTGVISYSFECGINCISIAQLWDKT